MNPQLFQQPFFQVTIPLMGTIIIATWAMVSTNNKRLEDLKESVNERLNRIDVRLDRIETRLDKIESLMQGHNERITRLEERTSPFHR